LCRRCYAARSRSRRRFAGNREAVLERDGHRCRVCGGGERVAVHHRRPGRHDRDRLISVCVRCHARLHRLAVLRRWVPGLLAQLWEEVHPGVPVQLQFLFEATA
jgi:5-methylcytosine-specific restriction endonuclease McrA